MESNEQNKLLIEADLPEDIGHEQDEWMAALTPHAASDVHESADDYDEVECVRDVNQHDWSQDCNTLAITQSDHNNLTIWVDEVKTALKSKNNDGDLGGTPTQLNFKQSVTSGLTRRHTMNVKVHRHDNVQQI